MSRVAWKPFSVAAILILVTFLAASSASLVFAPIGPMWLTFVVADLTVTPWAAPPGSPNFPSEIFVVLHAEGLANDLEGALFIFTPVSSCRISVPAVAAVSGTLFTNPTTGIQTLSFTGYLPPDPCIYSPPSPLLVKIVIGPAYYPPDPCILTFHVDGITATFTGETARFIVATVTTTTTTTTPPP